MFLYVSRMRVVRIVVFNVFVVVSHSPHVDRISEDYNEVEVEVMG